MELSRNQQNYVIMTVVYNEINDSVFGDSQRDATELMAELCEVPFEEVPDYIKNVVYYSLNKYDEIVTAFLPHLKNWTWKRIPSITKSILVMSYAHYTYVEKIDKKIIISIAIELAKKYIDEKQAKFINAILDEVL